MIDDARFAVESAMVGIKATFKTVAFFILLAPVVLAIGLCAYKYKSWKQGIFNAGKAEVQAKFDKHLQADKTAQLNAVAVQQAKQQALDEAAVKQKEILNEKISSIIHQRDNLIAELRNRPERPTSQSARGQAANLATTGANSEGCTGTGLYKGDAEFLTRYAADAATLKEHYLDCAGKYEKLSH